MLQDKIKNALILAMKEKDSFKVATLRLINAAIKDKEINLRGTRENTTLSDLELTNLLKSMVKSRENSINEYRKANREDYVAKEQAEIDVINIFLPSMYSEDKIIEITNESIAQSDDKSIKAIKSIIANIQSRDDAVQIDMGIVARLLKEKLSK